VERGECGAGIVYATDAAASSRVEVLARFPSGSHRPIVYPFALTKTARPEASEFLRYLRASTDAAAVFERHGFRWQQGAD
jgi:molybdate transport system substrate-binding protein